MAKQAIIGTLAAQSPARRGKRVGMLGLSPFPFRGADLGDDRGLRRHGLSRPAAALFSYPNQSFHHQAHRRDSMSSRCATIEICFASCRSSGRFLNTFYFSVGSALLATLLGGRSPGSSRARTRRCAAWDILPRSLPSARRLFFTPSAGCCCSARPGPVNYWLTALLDHSRAGGQCLFDVRHDFHRGAAVVAVCLSHAGGGVSFHGPVSGRSFGGLRRAGLADACGGFRCG